MSAFKHGNTKIPDNTVFRKMWDHDFTHEQIARVFGVKAVSVKGAARRYGYPGRKPEKHLVAKPLDLNALLNGDAEPVETPEVEAVAAFWTADRDAKVFQTQGKWKKIAALADEWGVPVQNITSRWHKLRVAK